MIQQSVLTARKVGAPVKWYQTRNKAGDKNYVVVTIEANVCPVCHFWELGDTCLNAACPTNLAPSRDEVETALVPDGG